MQDLHWGSGHPEILITKRECFFKTRAKRWIKKIPLDGAVLMIAQSSVSMAEAEALKAILQEGAELPGAKRLPPCAHAPLTSLRPQKDIAWTASPQIRMGMMM
jgi:hypothetical protein